MGDELTLQCHWVGHTLVVRTGPPDPPQLAFAESLADDPEHTVVVLDAAPDCPEASWEPALRVLSAARSSSLRLVPWGPRPGGLLPVGEWLAGRLGRTVLAPDGQPVAAARGALFVPPGAGTGWYRLEPGRPPRLDSRRFPRPLWTALAPLENPVALSAVSVLQPLPSGAWLYRQEAGEPGEHGLRLCAGLAWSHQTIDLVLGCPGAPDVPAADIDRLRALLPEQVRGSVRFVPYGSAPTPESHNQNHESERPVAPAIRLESGPEGGPEQPPPVRDNGRAADGVARPRVQPVPQPSASAVPPKRGIDAERQWLRRSLSRQFGAAASSVARVLSQTPGLRGGDGTPQDVLTDLVAVRLYLTGHGQRIDDAVRAARVGPHVPFARCVAAGLGRLPSYRGAARLRATLADAELRWYQSRRLVTEWAFCPALTDGSIRLPGTVDFLIWSMTARRTSLLAPEAAGQVLFLPGTSFKVLRVRDSGRPEVLLRELSTGEITAGGRVSTGRVPLDDLALTGLEKASRAWAGAEGNGELPGQDARRFGNPPGLIGGATEPGALVAARRPARAEGSDAA